MPGSNSVIRRYTPPTCTLEILAQSSPLSRWMGQTVLNQLRFQLHFDDPTLPEELKIPIQGDRDQLEALCHAVTNYVQGLLQKSADSFCLTSSESQPSTTTSHQPELSETSDSQDVTSNSSSFPKIPQQKSGMGILEATIYLESGENLTHKLYLGSLANQTSGPIIHLTLLQLFDLATALDEYAADVIALPDLKSEGKTKSRIFSLPTWTPIAAMLVLAVGLTPVTWQYANNIRNSQQQTATNTNKDSEKIALESPPSLNLATPGDIPSSTNNTTTLKLPDLDPSNTSTIPTDPSVNPTPLSFPNSIVTPSNPTSPQTSQIQPPITQPIIPDSLQIPPIRSSNSPQNLTTLTKPSRISSPTEFQTFPGQNNRSLSTIPESVATLSNPTQGYTPGQITSTQNLQPADSSNQTSASNNLVARLRNAKQSTSPTEVAARENTVFDVPQAAEAREVLQKNWQPPAGFSQTLEYSLMLGIDGTIERILPLNRAAREFVDNTGMPQIGQPFVSTNKSGQNLRLRVIFSPDGKVQTFPEQP